METILILLKRGADPSVKNKNSATVLHQFIISKKPKLLDTILTDYPGIYVNIGGENGSAPLHYCKYVFCIKYDL